jgi:predicted acylesterase/phospholipase RssA
MKRQNTEKRYDAIAVVLGGGARRGQLLPGFLAWLDESKIDISFYLCVSIGAVVGALRTNGYTSEKIGEILPEEMFNTGKTLASLCDPVALFHALFGFDIVPQIR